MSSFPHSCFGHSTEIHVQRARYLLYLLIGLLQAACPYIALAQDLPKAQVVFIPGFMGSKILQCNNSKSNCEYIWGGNTYETDLRLNSDYTYDYHILDKVEVTAVEKIKTYDVYTKLLSLLNENLVDGVSYNIFPYDWRIDLVKTANRLQEYLCRWSESEPTLSYYLLAHSMGGLVLKQWLREYSNAPCPNGRAIDIKGLAFVGTPHLGAPASIERLIAGLPMYSNPLSSVYTDPLSRSVIKAAPWLPSAYTLLPIVGNVYCRSKLSQRQINEAAALPQPLIFKAAADSAIGSASNNFDFFNIETWTKLSLLRYYDKNKLAVPSRDEIATYLQTAEARLCDASL
jgi:pimeloyl-ACP methyl ester carboxylesterase